MPACGSAQAHSLEPLHPWTLQQQSKLLLPNATSPSHGPGRPPTCAQSTQRDESCATKAAVPIKWHQCDNCPCNALLGLQLSSPMTKTRDQGLATFTSSHPSACHHPRHPAWTAAMPAEALRLLRRAWRHLPGLLLLYSTEEMCHLLA